jgi:ABC-type glycerol-3-phosphate transport system substrate-binding protein
MIRVMAIATMAAALLIAGCGGSDTAHKKEKKEDTMKVEDTAFGPLVGTPKKVQDRTDAAAEQYRESLDKRLEEDEGGTKKEDPPAN